MLWFALVCASSLDLTDPSPLDLKNPGEAVDNLNKIVKKFKAETNAREGVMHYFSLEDCQELVTKPNMTCYINNPASPYGLPLLPVDGDFGRKQCGTPNEPFCKQKYGDADGSSDVYRPAEMNSPEKDEAGREKVYMSASWQMKPEEAYVLIGYLPPKMKYFGITNYLLARTYERGYPDDGNLNSLERCWPKSAAPGGKLDEDYRTDVFASMGDSTNLMKFSAKLKKEPFGELVAVIGSPSRAAAEQAAAAAESAGVPKGRIFFQPFPGKESQDRTEAWSGLKLGHGKDDDALSALFRVTHPTDEKELQDYMVDLKGKALRPLRFVAELGADLDRRLYPRPPPCKKPYNFEAGTDASDKPMAECLTQRATGDFEGGKGVDLALKKRDGKRNLEKALTQLKDQVEAGLSWSKYTAEFNKNIGETKMESGVGDNGFECVRRGQKCQGDTRDTFYPAGKELLVNDFTYSGLDRKLGPIVASAIAGLDRLARGKIAGKLGELAAKKADAAAIDAKGKVSRDEAPKVNPAAGEHPFHASRSTMRDTRGTDDEDYFLVIGVQHARGQDSEASEKKRTASAVYSSVTAYHTWKLMGVVSADSADMGGSADKWLGTSLPDELKALKDDLYVVKFARECKADEKACYVIPVDAKHAKEVFAKQANVLKQDMSSLFVPTDVPLLFMERAYANPVTQVGAADADFLSPYIIHYSKPSKQSALEASSTFSAVRAARD